MNTKYLHLRVTPKSLEALRYMAKKQNISVSRLIKRSIVAWAQLTEKPGFAEALEKEILKDGREKK